MILPNPDHLYTVATEPAKESPSQFLATSPTDAEKQKERDELCAVVMRAQAGDMAAQSELVVRYRRRLAGHIRLIIRQPEAVEDVVQTVFIKMLRRLGRLRDAVAFESWLFRLSRNAALDFVRRRSRRPVAIGGDDDLVDLPDTRNHGAVGEIMEALDAALRQLSPKDRNLIRLFVEGHSYRTIAAREGLTTEAVKARLHRTRPFLRASVGQSTATRLPDGNGWGAPRPRLAA
ncbi:MAG: sigma-70 family RNA polymerase sigma factor [Opitutaceae bacterium]|nr:sigma-70 family RNA polymerase sigma factor [Opitutaceae bacterium]